MKKIRLYVSMTLSVIIAIPLMLWGLGIAFDLGNPARKTSEQIKSDILALTPLGTSANDVLEFVNANEWSGVAGSPARILDSGVFMGELGQSGDDVGEKSIRATAGKYTNFFKTTVSVWWAFDENGELIEVFVSKQTQGL